MLLTTRCRYMHILKSIRIIGGVLFSMILWQLINAALYTTCAVYIYTTYMNKAQKLRAELLKSVAMFVSLLPVVCGSVFWDNLTLEIPRYVQYEVWIMTLLRDSVFQDYSRARTTTYYCFESFDLALSPLATTLLVPLTLFGPQSLDHRLWLPWFQNES